MNARCVGGEVVVGATIAALLLSGNGGCVRTVEHKVARYRPGGEAMSQAVPETAVYRVKVARGKDGQLRTVSGTERVLRAGEIVGFIAASDGSPSVCAIAGGERLTIDAQGVRKMCWYGQSEEQTNFAKGMEAAADVGTVAILGAAIVGAAVAAHELKHDCCERSRRCHHHDCGRD